MSRPVCNREIPGGTCVHLQGHKSPCQTAGQKAAYEAQMRQVEADERAARQRRIDKAMGR